VPNTLIYELILYVDSEIRQNIDDILTTLFTQRVGKTFAEFLEKLRAPGLPGPEADWQTETNNAQSSRPGKKRKAEDEDEEMLDSNDDEIPLAKASKARGRPKGKGKAK
jgi:hypothetical protein